MHRSHSLTVAQSKTMESLYPDAYLLLDKYNRLLESHHKLLKVNQNLEDKLLKVVTTCEDQKADMKNQMEAMRDRMINAELRAEQLEEENVRYRRDCNLALSLLQCNPAGFVDHDFDSLPSYVRSKLQPAGTYSPDGISLDEDSDGDGVQRPDKSGIDIFPLPFPPSAVMVPVRRTPAVAPYRSSSNGSVNGTEQRAYNMAPKKISAEAIASVIQEDLRSMHSGMSNGDVRARQLTQNKQVNGSEPGRIMHV